MAEYVGTIQGGVLSGSQSVTGGILSSVAHLCGGAVHIAVPVLEEKTATPTTEAQTIMPDAGYGGLSSVYIAPIPQNYGLITWDGSTLTVS